jgi:hypothetical protein
VDFLVSKRPVAYASCATGRFLCAGKGGPAKRGIAPERFQTFASPPGAIVGYEQQRKESKRAGQRGAITIDYSKPLSPDPPRVILALQWLESDEWRQYR